MGRYREDQAAMKFTRTERLYLVLTQMCGYGDAEAAARMGVKKGTVHTLKTRVTEKLRLWILAGREDNRGHTRLAVARGAVRRDRDYSPRAPE